MAGHGGYKHRKIALKQKRRQQHRKAAANVAKVRAQFEEKGQTFDPQGNANQMAAMNHAGRRLVTRSSGRMH